MASASTSSMVNLTLTGQEAEDLLGLLWGHVVGPTTDGSPRANLKSISAALREVGVSASFLTTFEAYSRVHITGRDGHYPDI